MRKGESAVSSLPNTHLQTQTQDSCGEFQCRSVAGDPPPSSPVPVHQPVHPSSACPQIQSFSRALGSWLRADGVFSREDRLQQPTSQSAVFPSGNEPFASGRERSPQLIEIY